MSNLMEFIAVCQYPGKDGFAFYSDPFHVSDWAHLEEQGQRIVDDAWSKISPHPAPQVIGFVPGALVYSPERAA